MERRSVRIICLVAFVIVLATDLLYIALINAQGPSGQPYIPRFVASYLAVMAALIAVGLMPRPEAAAIRVPTRAAAAAGLLVLGVVAAFSIGTPLVLAGVLVTFVLSRTSREPRSRAARFSGLVAAALAVAVLLGGLEVTQRLIVCPETGQSAGGGSGFLSGPYQYECINGELKFHAG
jgi:hypothetical protein